ncbi:putative glucan endo-1,3-beta-glucosidase eglC [Cyphellophora attinorum]|uniref:glucan endo-1,3-beta-D-glucosidase n=1 Tax=Cyphellophora attinorum TaxID=1664694 RepID=A0A0N1HTD5_9EURO|nr:putative glucan endo-1,3-beta-glucosidase eglC [Phialophora attinorum]KPI39745.1 putative glucan endo-1,3-beta-glucosidase eglC [Phialophora attinorum]
MRTSVLAGLAAALPSTFAYHGFNYGATNLDGSVRVQSDYEAQFNAAKSLAGTNGQFTSARLYTSVQGTTGGPNSAFAAAVNTQTSLLLGIWISGNPNIQTEIDAILSAASSQGSAFTDLVAGISVGSEDAYRVTDLGIASGAGPGVDPQGIANYISQVRSGLSGNSALAGKPIGHVDTYNTYANSSNWMAPVVEASDFIGMNAFPYFESTKANGIENANSTYYADLAATEANAQGKPIWVTETGWPSSGPVSGAATASVANAEEYYAQVGCSLLSSGRNVWWYTLQDSTADASVPSFGVVSDLSFTPKYDLSC